MSLNFNGTNIGGNTGSGGTSNHSQLTNLDYASAGHTGFMSSENFIPVNTTYTVKADGTGDFSLLSEAISFLADKWSTGQINITIGAGTFVENDQIEIDSKYIGFPLIKIVGAGMDSTIIQNSSTKVPLRFVGLINANIILKDFTVENTNETAPVSIINGSGFKKLRLNGIKIKNAQYGLFLGGTNSEFAIEGAFTVENCTVCGIEVQNNSVLVVGQGMVTFNNMPLGVHVYRQSKVIFIATPLTFNSVTTKASIAINTQTTDGYIYTDSGTI